MLSDQHTHDPFLIDDIEGLVDNLCGPREPQKSLQEPQATKHSSTRSQHQSWRGRKSTPCNIVFSEVDDLPSFLHVLRLHKYTPALLRAGLDLHHLLHLSEPELVRVGVAAQGARTRLLVAAQKFLHGSRCPSEWKEPPYYLPTYMNFDLGWDGMASDADRCHDGIFMENVGRIRRYSESSVRHETHAHMDSAHVCRHYHPSIHTFHTYFYLFCCVVLFDNV